MCAARPAAGAGVAVTFTFAATVGVMVAAPVEVAVAWAGVVATAAAVGVSWATGDSSWAASRAGLPATARSNSMATAPTKRGRKRATVMIHLLRADVRARRRDTSV